MFQLTFLSNMLNAAHVFCRSGTAQAAGTPTLPVNPDTISCGQTVRYCGVTRLQLNKIVVGHQLEAKLASLF